MNPLWFLLAIPWIFGALLFIAICVAASDADDALGVDYLEFGSDHIYEPTGDELADIMPFDWKLEQELRDERRARAALRPRTGNVDVTRRAA